VKSDICYYLNRMPQRFTKVTRYKLVASSVLFFLLTVAAVASSTKITQFSGILVDAFKVRANLSVDLNAKTIALNHIWQNLAQGGEDPAFSPAAISSHISDLQPQYIRIDHLYDFYIAVTRNPQGQLMYDYTRLDKLLEEIRAANAAPFISLSYAPDILNADLTGKPSSYATYQEIVRQTISHISGKDNLNIPNVYYEVWNEPDLFGQWKTYGEKNYVDLYMAVNNAAASVTNTQPFKLGGPATTKIYKNWIESLVKLADENRIRLDFISWHHYDEDPDAVISDIAKLRSWMKPYTHLGYDLEIIITEWGIHSDNNEAYDNHLSAAHLVSTLANMVPVIDRVFIFEIQDGKGPQEFWGRWGLITHSDYGSHLKPRGEAIKLLNQLGNTQMKVEGQGSWVRAIATKKDNNLSMVIANYDPSNTHGESVPLTIRSLPNGKYLFHQAYVGRTATYKTVTVTDSTLTATIEMLPNAVVYVALYPQE
jgi:hypothetical protein